MKKNTTSPELLAPAGGMEHFEAAVENGADAIYFGGKGFNAREFADNFGKAEMQRSVAYAHKKGVKAYMTLNTLVKEEEFSAALKQAAEGAESGADAFIVQDLGLAALLRKEMPEAPLHLSTQGTVYDPEGVKMARELGFKRVVLARELSLEQIRECAAVPGIETEVFVHGALCMCLSGQCAMSALIGGRSGNRGQCAQPCRRLYELENEEGERLGEKGYLLSPRDISYLNDLDKLVRAGVDSLKIEGRLKSPEYAALAVGTFRKYLDRVCGGKETAAADPADTEKLRQVFSRGAFTRGYLYGKPGGALLSGESPKHRGLFLGEIRRVRPSAMGKEKSLLEVELDRELRVGDGIEVMAPGFPGGVVSYIKGRKQPVRAAKARERVWIGDIPGNPRPGDLVYKVTDRQLLEEIRRTYEGGMKRAETPEKTAVRGVFVAAEGRLVQFSVTDGRYQASARGSVVLEPAEKAPTGEEAVLTQLKKTGNTPFVLAECRLEMKPGLMIPMSEVKKVRREALEQLQELREKSDD